MKITRLLVGLAALSLTACSILRGGHHSLSKPDPETVMVTYHVKLGKEAEFEALLSRAWRVYRKEHLVMDKPHLVLRSIEDGDKTRFVEIFTWLSHAEPEHAPDTVKSLWEEEQSLCEPRSGHRGIEGGEVEFVANK